MSEIELNPILVWLADEEELQSIRENIMIDDAFRYQIPSLSHKQMSELQYRMNRVVDNNYASYKLHDFGMRGAD